MAVMYIKVPIGTNVSCTSKYRHVPLLIKSDLQLREVRGGSSRFDSLRILLMQRLVGLPAQELGSAPPNRAVEDERALLERSYMSQIKCTGSESSIPAPSGTYHKIMGIQTK